MSGQLKGLRHFVAARAGRPWTASRSRRIVVASGKGGVGTSTVTFLLGIAASRAGYNTLLMDTDELSGSLHRMAGLEATHSLDAVANGAVPLAEAVLPIAPQLSLISGGSAVHDNPGPMPRVDHRAFVARCEPLYAEYDCVIVDAGATIARVLAATSRPTQQVLLVAGHDRIALAASFAMAKVVDGQSRGIPLRAVFNRTGPQPAAHAFSRLAAATQRFLSRPIGLAGCIPDCAGVTSADSPAAFAQCSAMDAVEPMMRSLLMSPQVKAALMPAAANA